LAAADLSVTSSTSISELVWGVREQSFTDFWIGDDGKLHLGASWRAALTTDSLVTLTDETEIVDGSVTYEGNAQAQLTQVIVYYNYLGGEADAEKASSYAETYVYVDAAVDAISGVKTRKIFSEWIYRNKEALSLATRLVAHFKHGAPKVTLQIDIKDDVSVSVGDLIIVDSRELLTASGGAAARGNTVWQVVQKADEGKGLVNLELALVRWKRYGLIGPSTLTAYSDYTTGDTELKYAFIGSATNTVNGDDGYYIL
jgi:hypothetical protein